MLIAGDKIKSGGQLSVYSQAVAEILNFAEAETLTPHETNETE